MKKSIVLSLLIFELLILFVITNIGSLFKAVKEKEIFRLKSESIAVAEAVFKYNPGASLHTLDRKDSFFDRIYLSHTPVENHLKSHRDRVTFVYRIQTSGGYLVFEKNSPLLLYLDRIKQITDLLTILIVVFLVITALFFVTQLKKKPSPDSELPRLDPLKKYLKTLRESENHLQTSLSRHEEQAASREKINRSIVDNINAAIIFTNPAGRVEIFNHTARTLFHRTYAQSIHEELTAVLAPYPEIQGFLRNRRSRTSGQVSCRDQTYSIDFIPVEKTGNLIIIRDITRDIILKRVSEKARNFSMLGEMSATLSHEIRNSLGVIYGYTKTLKTPRSKIDCINREIDHVTDMINRFLNFSRPMEASGQKTICLRSLTEELAGEAGLELVWKGGNDLRLESDPTLLKSAFLNLFLNARQAGARRIVITAERPDPARLTIDIRDDGQGIPKKHLEKVWYPFFTTREKGSGMGLPIVRKTVTLLNGEVDLVQSGTGGTKFRLVFYRI